MVRREHTASPIFFFFCLALNTVIIHMAYRTAVIVQFTVSKQLITCPCDSYVIQRTYPLIISWHAEFEQWSA